MTSNRNKATDIAETKNQLKALSPAAQVIPNWLGHKGGNAHIDYELLQGTTMASMEQHRGAVEQHLEHLRSDHGLEIEEKNGVYRFKP